MLRILRSAVWISCLIACVGFVAIWVRSYSWHDSLTRLDAGQYRDLVSWNGRIIVRSLRYPREIPGEQFRPLTMFSSPAHEWEDGHRHLQRIGSSKPSNTRFWEFRWSSSRASAPIWFFVLVAAGLAFLLKPTPRLKFTMLDLVVGLTLGAVALAGLAAFMRSIALDP